MAEEQRGAVMRSHQWKGDRERAALLAVLVKISVANGEARASLRMGGDPDVCAGALGAMAKHLEEARALFDRSLWTANEPDSRDGGDGRRAGAAKPVARDRNSRKK